MRITVIILMAYLRKPERLQNHENIILYKSQGLQLFHDSQLP